MYTVVMNRQWPFFERMLLDVENDTFYTIVRAKVAIDGDGGLWSYRQLSGQPEI